MPKKKLELLFAKCDSCGDDMTFDADSQSLYCPSCKVKKEIQKKRTYVQHKMNKDALLHHGNEDWLLVDKSLNCSNCGALITVEGFQVSAHCPYCNTSMLFKSIEQWGIKPDGIIPFSISRELAGKIFGAKIHNNWLVPKALKKGFKVEAIEAFYFPSFVYGAECISNYKATVYEIETYTDSEGNMKSCRTYYKRDGTHSSTHTNVTVEASSKLSQMELSLVKPYDFSKAVDYSNDFVFGYDIECYSNSVNEMFGYANAMIEDDIKRQITRDLRRFYDGVSRLDVDVSYLRRDYSYCLLPMYRTSFKYNGKTYSNVINGQTGAYGGKVPKSGWKISLIVLLPILAVLLIVLLAIFI